MSRVGKKPITIPQGVEVKIENRKITAKGLKGELSLEVRPEIKVEIKEGKLFVLSERSDDRRTNAFWGLTRALLANMLKGVAEGYEKRLEIEGIGMRAVKEGDNLSLSLGFSHPVKINAPSGIKFSVEKNIIIVSGIDKELVGQTAAVIRKKKPVEPYKGKGIRYAGEQIRKKEGKKAATAAAK